MTLWLIRLVDFAACELLIRRVCRPVCGGFLLRFIICLIFARVYILSFGRVTFEARILLCEIVSGVARLSLDFWSNLSF